MTAVTAQSKFAQDPISGLLRCHEFIAPWQLVLAVWNTGIRPPFPDGPRPQDVQASMLQMVQRPYLQVLRELQQCVDCQDHIARLPAFAGDSAAAQAGQAAHLRLQALSFASGFIQALDAADSCFAFGPHFNGGANADRREAYFRSPNQREYAVQYVAAVRRLADILSAPAPEGTQRPFSPIDRESIDTFAGWTLPYARQTLQKACEHCLNTVRMTGGFLGSNPDSSAAISDELSAQAQRTAEFGDKVLRAAEGLIDCVPSFVLSLREIGEEELADSLRAIVQN